MKLNIVIFVAYVLALLQTLIGVIYTGVYIVLGPPSHGIAGPSSSPMSLTTAWCVVMTGVCVFLLVARGK